MNISKELRVGLMAIVAIALLIFGYNFLKGKNLLENSRTFYAVYDQVEGLSPSSAVTINGLQIGSVTDIKIRNDAKLVVTMNIKNSFSFSETSIAEIYGGDLIGGKSIAIVPDFENNINAKSGDTLQGQIEAGLLELVNDQLAPLQTKVESVVSSVDTLVRSVNYVMDTGTRESIKKSINDFNKTVKHLNSTAENVDFVLSENLEDIQNTIHNASETSEKLKQFSDTLSQVEFGKMVNNINTTISSINSITAKIDNGDGSIGKLMNDDKLYVNLEKASKQLEELLQDLKLNPKRYMHFSVFGKKNKEYVKPENRDQ
ncbi:MlaD family protein [Mesohalobacter halotolerans]|uniref:MlaD family protein n=1 Tax=Mesohalobacter halotolerans TaxID=1883405 RepID=UPI001486E567|nr:MlaD family protein [Mesohalobacter halotolerans]MBS3737646.1 MCE family protein [Psychroflexus sp.]